MDAHHDQVMKARAQAGAGSKLYFAYSTILDRAAFEEWRTQHGYEFFDLPPGRLARAVGVGLVYDFPSRWWGGRVAGLEDRAGAEVFGLVFEISERDWPVIAHKEGGVTGMAIERAVTVELEGKQVQAVAFTTNPARKSSDGPVSARFQQALVQGATQAGLPAAYVKVLAEAKG